MKSLLIKICLVVGLSSVKHASGAPLAASLGFSYLEAALLMTFGGLLGILIMLYCMQTVKYAATKYLPSKKKKVFNKRNRMIVKVRKKFGMAGLALIGPLVISLPITVIIMTAIFGDKRKVLLYTGLSVVLWSFMLSGILQPIIGMIA